MEFIQDDDKMTSICYEILKNDMEEKTAWRLTRPKIQSLQDRCAEAIFRTFDLPLREYMVIQDVALFYCYHVDKLHIASKLKRQIVKIILRNSMLHSAANTFFNFEKFVRYEYRNGTLFGFLKDNTIYPVVPLLPSQQRQRRIVYL